MPNQSSPKEEKRKREIENKTRRAPAGRAGANSNFYRTSAPGRRATREAPFAAMKLSILLPQPSPQPKNCVNDSMLELALSSVGPSSFVCSPSSRIVRQSRPPLGREKFSLTWQELLLRHILCRPKSTLTKLEPSCPPRSRIPASPIVTSRGISALASTDNPGAGLQRLGGG
jgi:hypothetical protein